RARHYPQGTVLHAGAYRRDARPFLIITLADHDAGAAELQDLTGARRIAVPGNVARQPLRVVGQGLLAATMLPRQPQDVVAVQHPPDRGKGVADAEIEATDAAAGR